MFSKTLPRALSNLLIGTIAFMSIGASAAADPKKADLNTACTAAQKKLPGTVVRCPNGNKPQVQVLSVRLAIISCDNGGTKQDLELRADALCLDEGTDRVTIRHQTAECGQ